MYEYELGDSKLYMFNILFPIITLGDNTNLSWDCGDNIRALISH
jgi:hypothetical protein